MVTLTYYEQMARTKAELVKLQAMAEERLEFAIADPCETLIESCAYQLRHAPKEEIE